VRLVVLQRKVERGNYQKGQNGGSGKRERGGREFREEVSGFRGGQDGAGGFFFWNEGTRGSAHDKPSGQGASSERGPLAINKIRMVWCWAQRHVLLAPLHHSSCLPGTKNPAGGEANGA